MQRPACHSQCHMQRPACHFLMNKACFQLFISTTKSGSMERSGSVVECLTRDRRAAGSSLTGVTALWSLSRHIFPSLVLVQHRKIRPYIIERLLMGRKESNQTKQTNVAFLLSVSIAFCLT